MAMMPICTTRMTGHVLPPVFVGHGSGCRDNVGIHPDSAGPNPNSIGSPQDVSAPGSQTRLYLQLAAGDGAEARLRSALSAAVIDAVMIAPPAGSHRDPSALRALVALAQSHNAAALVEGDAALAELARADGVHLPWSEAIEDAYDAARKVLGPGRILGAEASASRHDAMTLAEAGADYIAFARSFRADDEGAPLAGQAELVRWWAEIFEVPCVALGVRGGDEAAALAQAGADFLGIEAEAGLSPDAMATRVRTIEAALQSAQSPSRDSPARGKR
jgi:thiamine-phosphate pyrophosphorylase